MAKKQIIRLISPSLDKQINNLIKTLEQQFGRKIGYKQGCKVYAHVYSQKPKLDLTMKRLNEILGNSED